MEQKDTESDFGSQVAEEIRVLLVRRRLSAAELARQMGVTQSYLARRLLRGERLDLEDLRRIAAVLKVSVVDLLPSSARDVVSDVSFQVVTGRYPINPVSAPPASNGARRPPARRDSSGPPRETAGAHGRTYRLR